MLQSPEEQPIEPVDGRFNQSERSQPARANPTFKDPQCKRAREAASPLEANLCYDPPPPFMEKPPGFNDESTVPAPSSWILLSVGLVSHLGALCSYLQTTTLPSDTVMQAGLGLDNSPSLSSLQSSEHRLGLLTFPNSKKKQNRTKQREYMEYKQSGLQSTGLESLSS